MAVENLVLIAAEANLTRKPNELNGEHAVKSGVSKTR